MWPRYSRNALLAALLALAPACQEQGNAPQLQLITTACEGLQPLEGATHLRLRVTGEGLDTPIERITPVNLRPEDLPDIPAGAARVLEVRAYSGEPTSPGPVLSVGRSIPFEMPEKGAPSEPLRIILRRVDTFVSVESGENPGTCLDLTEPRAGHTATLLPDGRVVLAGGFRVTDEGAVETLSSVEILDPQAGTLTYLPDPGLGAVRRAFHTASLMLDGRVALLGGETQEAGGDATVLATGAVFDPATERVQQFDLSTPRTHHAAAIDIAGHILMVGGVGSDGAVVSSPEGVEPAAGKTFAVPTPVPRMGVSLVTLADQQRIAVIGGSDGVNLARDVLTFAFSDNTFSLTNDSVVLRQPRRDAAVAAYDDGQKLLVVGGYSSVGTPDFSARPVAASELIGLREGAPFVAVGPSIVSRGDLCAVALQGGRMFTSGGRRIGENGLESSGVTELITPTEHVTGGVLGMAPVAPGRYLHTCTPLADGSVLVVGGADAGDRGLRLVTGMYVFMPVPRD